MQPDQGIPGWFVGFFVLAVLIGIGTTVWRVSVARKMSQQAGLDPNSATAVTLLSKDGLDATYLASSLASRSQQPPPAESAPAPRATEQRLRELQALKDQGLISQDEYDTRRSQILGEI